MLVYIKPLSLFPDMHSDTLFGAIVSAISNILPNDVEELLDSFDNNPPFIISSPFPYVTSKEERIRFYPKVLDSNNNEDLDPIKLKQYKSIKYYDEETFLDYINGNITVTDLINNLDDYNIKNSMLIPKKYDVNFKINEKIIPGNTVNRLNDSSENIFYTAGLEYENSGVYFFIQFFDEKYVKIIKSALKFLKDAGFGQDISTGKGQFDYEIIEENEIEETLFNHEGDYFLTLSRYIPKKTELENIQESGIYDFSSKRGRGSNGEIRKQVRFFTEGSTFYHNQKTYGQNINSGINQPAVEYGYAFMVRYNRRHEKCNMIVQ